MSASSRQRVFFWEGSCPFLFLSRRRHSHFMLPLGSVPAFQVMALAHEDVEVGAGGWSWSFPRSEPKHLEFLDLMFLGRLFYGRTEGFDFVRNPLSEFGL